MRVEYNINKVQDMSYPLAQYGLLDVHSPVAPGLTMTSSMYLNLGNVSKFLLKSSIPKPSKSNLI
jgi:hypothetical protein